MFGAVGESNTAQARQGHCITVFVLLGDFPLWAGEFPGVAGESGSICLCYTCTRQCSFTPGNPHTVTGWLGTRLRRHWSESKLEITIFFKKEYFGEGEKWFILPLDDRGLSG